MDDSKPCALCGLVQRVVDFLKRPFNPQGSALQWLGFVGLLIIILWFWHVTIMAVTEEL